MVGFRIHELIKIADALNVDKFSIEGIPAEQQLQKNREWIQGKLKEGYSVFNIGLDPKYTSDGSY